MSSNVEINRLTHAERQSLLQRLRDDVDVIENELMRPTPSGSLTPISELAAKVRHARRRDGLTQAELADLADVSVLVVGRVERDGDGVTMKSLMRICTALGIRVWLE